MDAEATTKAIYLVFPLVQQSITSSGRQPIIHQSLEDFIDLFLRDFMEQEAVDSGEASSEMALTNGYLDMVEVDNVEPDQEFLKANANWRAVGSGVIYMEQDQDKPFSGDTIKIAVTVDFDKTGRIGLTYVEREVSARLDYDWGDEE
jgi:hypothetical protein